MARLVFDLDGTLVHSAPTMTTAANAMLAGIGRGPATEDVVLGFVGHGMRRLVEKLLAATGGAPEAGVDACLGAYRRHYEADPVTGTVAYPGALAALSGLAAEGHGLAVCTQKPDGPARAILKGLGLMPPVAALTGGDSLPGVLKPDPRLFRHAADQLPGGGPEIMVGDSETDAATARAAGARFLFHTEGYNARRPETFGADGVFGDYAELPGLVSGILART